MCVYSLCVILCMTCVESLCVMLFVTCVNSLYTILCGICLDSLCVKLCVIGMESLCVILCMTCVESLCTYGESFEVAIGRASGSRVHVCDVCGCIYGFMQCVYVYVCICTYV